MPEVEHRRKQEARKNYPKPLLSPSDLQRLAKYNHKSTSKGAQEMWSTRVIFPRHKARPRRMVTGSAGGKGRAENKFRGVAWLGFQK